MSMSMTARASGGLVPGLGGRFVKLAGAAPRRAGRQRAPGPTSNRWVGVEFLPRPCPEVSGRFSRPFTACTGYFESGARPFMFNLTVDALAAMAARPAGANALPRRASDKHGDCGCRVDCDDNEVGVWLAPAVLGAWRRTS